mgnify:CR=1 FL=1
MFHAIKFLEKDPEIEDILKHNPNYEIWKQIRDDENERIHKELHEDVSSAIAAEKYGFIQGALKENMEGSVAKEESRSP